MAQIDKPDFPVICAASILLKQRLFRIRKLSLIKYDMLGPLEKKIRAARVIQPESSCWPHWPSCTGWAGAQLGVPTP